MSKALWHLLNLSNEEALTDFYHENLSAPRAISISPEDFLLVFQKRPEPFTGLHSKFSLLEVDLERGGSGTAQYT